MFCHKCGTQIADGAGFCHKCGTKVVYDSTGPQTPETETIDKTNTRVSFRKPTKIISWILVPIIILVLIRSGTLKTTFDALIDLNREIENQAIGATTVPRMRSAAGISSSDSSEETTGNALPNSDYDDGMMEYDDLAEDYYGQSSNLDPSLVGRWRSYDGGTLEFSDSGLITSCDFQCWSLIGRKPDWVYWETSNGRVTCSAYFCKDVKYWIFKQFEGQKDEREIITLAGGDSDYYRESGTYGGGIVGKWVSVYGEVWSYQFNEDGTGMWNGKYPITWYTYTMDDGASVLNYTLEDSTYFDYTITGDTLTVFLSDGSRVYTKVGW